MVSLEVVEEGKLLWFNGETGGGMLLSFPKLGGWREPDPLFGDDGSWLGLATERRTDACAGLPCHRAYCREVVAVDCAEGVR